MASANTTGPLGAETALPRDLKLGGRVRPLYSCIDRAFDVVAMGKDLTSAAEAILKGADSDKLPADRSPRSRGKKRFVEGSGH